MRPGLTQQEGGAKVLTLQDVVRAAEAQRRFPNWIIWVVVFVVAAWAIGTAVRAFPWQAAGSPAVQQEQQVQIGPAPVVEPPAQNTQPEVTASREIETPWVLIDTGLPTTETLNRLKIPWEQGVLVSAPWSNEELRFPEGQAGLGTGAGDDMTFFVQAQDGTYHLTVDRGETWYPIRESPPVNDRYGNPDSGPLAVYRDGERVVMYVETDYPQTEEDPFLTAFWKNEVSLSELEGLAP